MVGVGGGEYPGARSALAGETELFGRDEAVAAARAGLESAPVVTLAGPAGVGKSRLARAVAKTSADMIIVDLAEARRADDVWLALARGLDVAIGRGCPGRALGRRMAANPQLVILDNAERAVRALAEVVPALSAECGVGKLLVTSREPLGVPGERVVQVEPLDSEAAAMLFVARARAADPYFEASEEDAAAIVGIAERLDGIPLAIELAAARTSVMRPPQLLTRLESGIDLLAAGKRSSTARHPTLRLSIEWSLEHLDSGERELLARLSVIPGSFDRLIAAKLGASGDQTAAWLAALHRKSLVSRAGPGRYRMLGMIREIAGETLDQESGERESAEERLVATMVERAAMLEALRAQRGLSAALEAIRRDYDGLREALMVELERGGPSAPTLLVALDPLLAATAIDERHRLATRVLELGSMRPAARAAVVRILGECAELRGRSDDARELYESAYDLAAPLTGGTEDSPEDALLAGRLHINLANACSYCGDYDGALEHYGRALHIFEECEHLEYQSLVLTNTASIERRRGDWERATTAYRGSLELAERLGDPMRIALTLGFGGELFIAAGAMDRARVELARAREIWNESGLRHPRFVLQLFDAGEIERFEGNVEGARALYEQTLEQARALGYRMGEGGAELALGICALAAGQQAGARHHLTRAIECLSGSTWTWLGLAHAYLAAALAASGDREAARGHAERARSVASQSSSSDSAIEVLCATVHEAVTGPEGESCFHPSRRPPTLKGEGESPEARFARSVLAQLFAGPQAILTLGPELMWFELDGHLVSLARRGAMRRILGELVKNQRRGPIDMDAFIAVGWPDEVISADAAVNRFHVTMTRLRKLGLGEWILAGADGYRLETALRIQHSAERLTARQ